MTRRRAGRLGFLLLAPWFTVVSLLSGSAPAIYNGYNASIHSFPWMVSLRFATSPNSHLCNGTLIEPDIVLTAGHCVDPSAKGQHGLVAVVGADDPSRFVGTGSGYASCDSRLGLHRQTARVHGVSEASARRASGRARRLRVRPFGVLRTAGVRGDLGVRQGLGEHVDSELG